MTEQQPTSTTDDLTPAELIAIALLATGDLEKITLYDLQLIYGFTGVKPSEIVEEMKLDPITDIEETEKNND